MDPCSRCTSCGEAVAPTDEAHHIQLMPTSETPHAESSPPLRWLTITIVCCGLLGVIPLDQALDRIGMPGAIGLALRWQLAAMPVWLVVARPFARRWPLADKEAGALAGLALLSLATTCMQAVLVMLIVRPPSPYAPVLAGTEVALGMLPVTALTVCLISLVGSWTSARRQQQRAADREASLAAAVVRTELEALRTRLQPHFLLNALNTVVGLARRHEGERAADVAADLGELLRFSLAETSDDVAFDAEREIVERYLSIEQARLGDRLTVRWHLDPAVRTTRLPALLWQPLVENAIRHGIARRMAPGMLTLTAKRDAACLRLVIDADGPEEATPQVPADELGGLGIGLSTVQRRLHLLHGDQAGVMLSMRVGGSITELRLPLPADE